MIRITITHVNKYGPLEFPAKQSQIFIESGKVPHENLKEFYKASVSLWAKEHGDRQVHEWVKDIVDASAMPDGSKYYTANKDAMPHETNEEPL